MMKLKLIPEWKRAWKFASIRWNLLGVLAMGVIEFLNQTWQTLPPDIRDNLPHASKIAMVLFVLSIIGRMFKKKEATDGD
ncbi:holin [Pseudomonas phage Zuri]|jgi:hypothetical protein|uniref:Holin n=1 Tax=Pseudomonas phage Zuri TaxID=2604899 RepID=A0A5C1K5F4_9CAUD|nr:holin [Pseudomonas phage Zuri]QEM41180.1 holin [Pseudomonas phage Zuri]